MVPRPPVLLVLASAVALFGCTRGANAPAAPLLARAAASDANPVPAAPGSNASAPGAGVAPSAAQLERYARFQQAFLGRLEVLEKDWASRQVPDNADPEQLAKGHRALVDAARTAARDQAGLDAAEEQRLTPVVDAVVADRILFEQAGGDEALRELASAEQRIAKTPAEQRARAEAEYHESKQILLDLKNARRARTRFGDAAVDAVLAHDDLVGAQERIDRLLPRRG